ncbi:hypothetical protein [Paraburkholderia madseniana]|uniref:hypothetical protein n=1 Tax=Paraburkholderia madseniana TaxID=2599607 RepID=UPI0018EB5CE8|nr:hypothetical protein [Paraburkholderia madseniana]
MHTTVHNLADQVKLQPLLRMQSQYPARSKLFEADRRAPRIVRRVDGMVSDRLPCASPAMLPEKIRNGQRQMLKPAMAGITNALRSVDHTYGVRRVVMTSKVRAIFDDYIDMLNIPNQIPSERLFNRTITLKGNPFHYAKVEPQKVAWKTFESTGAGATSLPHPTYLSKMDR